MSKKRESDELLSQVYSKHEGPMQEINFLNTVFAFINRRSNVLAQPGIIKQVTNLLQKHIDIKQKEIEDKKSKEKTNEIKTNEIKTNEIKTNEIKPNDNKSTTQEIKKEDVIIKEQNKTQEKSTTDDHTKNDKNIETNDNNNNPNDNNENDKKNLEVSNKEGTSKESKTKPKVIGGDEEEPDSGSPPPIGNGGKTDSYIWTQTLYEIEMKLKVPTNVTKRDLNISIGKNKVKVQLKKTNETILDGEPHGPVDADESSWTLDQEYGASYKTLTLILPKKKRYVLVGFSN